MELNDPVQAVLRDFENVLWLILIVGLVLFGAWRFFFRSGDEHGDIEEREESAPESFSESENETEAAFPSPKPAKQEDGVPVAHFTLADLFFLPLVLVKYSVTLQLLGAKLFAAPGQAAEKAGLVEGAPTAEKLTEPVVMEISSLQLFVLMGIDFLLIGMVLLMIEWVGGRRVSTVFGFGRFRSLQAPARWLRPALWIAAGAIIATPTIIVVSNMMPQFLEGIFGENLNEQAAVQNIRESSNTVMKVLLILNACLLAPFVEELVFRGYFYGIMKRYTGAMFAAFVTGGLFAVAHQNLLALLPLWGFSLFLTLFYEGSRSLWVPIGIHAAFNTANVLLIVLGVGGDGL